jgi:hypothetical protein
MGNLYVTPNPGQLVMPSITPAAAIKISESSGMLQNLVVTETGNVDAFVILVEGTGNVTPDSNDGIVGAFKVAAGTTVQLAVPIKFTDGLWVMFCGTLDIADTPGIGIAFASIH